MKPSTAITPKTPYLFIEIWVPRRAPYNRADCWSCIIGDFIKPVMDALPTALIWYVREGKHLQLCIATSERAKALRLVKRVATLTRFRVKRVLPGTVGGALAGTRWMSAAKIGTPAEGARSILMLRAMDAVCRLHLNTLVPVVNPVDGYPTWRYEQNADARQNPHGSLFESFTHLIANATEAQFTIHLMARTGWMDWAPAQVTANL